MDRQGWISDCCLKVTCTCDRVCARVDREERKEEQAGE